MSSKASDVPLESGKVGAEDRPDFSGVAEDYRKLARRSTRNSHGYLCLILVLLAGTFLFWWYSADFAAEGIKTLRAANNAPAMVAPSNPVEFEDVASCGGTTIAVGGRGAILISIDEGKNWEYSKSGTKRSLYAVAFSGDCEIAVVVGENGVVLVSTDDGGAWEAPETHTKNDFNDVVLSGDGKIAIAVGDRGLFRFSEDMGKNWSSPDNVTGKHVYGVALSDDGGTAVAVGRDNLIVVSTNGGKDWRDGGGRDAWSGSGGEESDDFEAVALGGMNGKSAVVVGDNGAILFSTDAAKVGGWASKGPGKDRNSDFTDVAFSGNGSTAVAVGRRGVVWASTDGGIWSRRESRVGNNLEAVALSDDGAIAVAVGRDGDILVSEDQEKRTWTSRESSTANRLYAAALVHGKKALVVVGEGSTILRSESSSGEIFPTMERGRLKGDARREQQAPGEERINLTESFQHYSLLVGITAVFMFMAQHLFGLVGYSLRIAAFYYARRNAIRLTQVGSFPNSRNIDELYQLMQALSPDTLEIGRPSRTMMDRMMWMMDRLIAGGRYGHGKRPGRPGTGAGAPNAGRGAAPTRPTGDQAS